MSRPRLCKSCSGKIIPIENLYPEVCPSCGQDWTIPPMEAELQRLQTIYLKDKTRDNFGNFLEPVGKVLNNIILGKMQRSGVNVDPDELNDLTAESLEKVIKLFRNPNFHFKNSCIGYLQDVVLYPMFNKTKKEYQQKVCSYDAPLKSKAGANDDVKTLMSLLEQQTSEHDINASVYESDLVTEILSLIELIYLTACIDKTPYDGYLILHLISQYFNNRQSAYFDSFFMKYGDDYRQYFERSILVIKNFITEYERVNNEH